MNAGQPTQGRRINRRRSPAEREQLIEEQRASGLSRREFCEQRGLNLMTFYGWFKAVPDQRRKTKPVAKPFVEVAMPQQDASSEAEIEIELPNGAHVWIRPGSDQRNVVELVRGITVCAEARRC